MVGVYVGVKEVKGVNSLTPLTSLTSKSTPCILVFPFNVFFVLCYLAFANVGKAVVFVVLTVVEADAFAVLRNSHWDDLVDEPIAKIADDEGIYYYYREEVIKVLLSPASF